jgi:hypothetical protein
LRHWNKKQRETEILPLIPTAQQTPGLNSARAPL